MKVVMEEVGERKGEGRRGERGGGKEETGGAGEGGDRKQSVPIA